MSGAAFLRANAGVNAVVSLRARAGIVESDEAVGGGYLLPPRRRGRPPGKKYADQIGIIEAYGCLSGRMSHNRAT
jgi:hypothetical protein